MTKKWIKKLSEEAVHNMLQECAESQLNNQSYVVKLEDGKFVYYDKVTQLVSHIISIRQEPSVLIDAQQFTNDIRQLNKIQKLLV